MNTAELSSLDEAFLAVERCAPMHLGAVIVLGGGETTAHDVADELARRAARVPRLRQRVRPALLPFAASTWAEAPRFDARNHVHVHVSTSGGWLELSALTGRLMGEPLDMMAPLWEMHVISGWDDDRDAVVIKLHHALCDGHGALQIGLALLDGPEAQPSESQPDATPEPGLAQLIDEVISGAHRFMHALPHVAHLATDVASCLRVNASSRFTSIPRRVHTRRVAMTRLSATDITRARRRHGGTVNDVLLTVLSGALRTWLSNGGMTDEVRALIPVNHRVRSGDDRIGNQLSGYLFQLPVTEPDPRRRFEHITAAMASHKAAGPLRGPGAFPLLAQGVPPVVHHLVTPLLATQARRLFDLVVTTIRLPADFPALVGRSIDGIYPLAPLAPGHQLAVAFTHDRRHVHVGVTIGPEAADSVDKLVEALHVGLSELALG